MRIQWNRRQFLKQSAIGVAALSATSLFSSRSLRAAELNPETTWGSFRNGPENWGIAKTALPEKLTLKWSVKIAEGTSSTAAIADGHVYIGTLGGDLLCLQLSDGKEVWKYRSAEVVAANSFAPGFNAAVAIDQNSVYLGDDQGFFHAVDRATGKRRWQIETEGEIVGGAQIHNGNVIFGSHDGYLYCHKAETGERVWAVETNGPVNATPCIAGKYTFTTGCDKPILRVVDLELGKQASEIPLNSLLIAAAAVRDDILYFGTDNGTVTALDWQTKKTVWEYAVPGREQQIHSSPAVTEDLLVIGSRGKRVDCLERKTGKLVWSFSCRAKIDSSPVIVGKHVYFGASDKNVYGVTLADGTPVFKEFVRNAVTGSPAVADGRLVIGTESTNGQIACFA